MKDILILIAIPILLFLFSFSIYMLFKTGGEEAEKQGHEIYKKIIKGDINKNE